MTDFDRQTLDYYSSRAPTYTASGAGGRNRYLDWFLGQLPERAKILELGCGGGRDARYMLDSGFSVVATEASPAIASMAERVLGQKVQVQRFDEICAENEYDAIWASASLIHVPRTALAETLVRVFLALKPSGLHFATYKGGGQEGRDSVGRYYNYPSKDELLAYYERAGVWDLMKLDEYMGGGFENGAGPWIAICVRRRP